MADQDLAGLPSVQRWHATGDYAYPAEEREDGEFVEYEAYCALARENVALKNERDWAEWLCEKCNTVYPRKSLRAGLHCCQCPDDTCRGPIMPRETALRRRAEAELAALKRKIAEAPTTELHWLDTSWASHPFDQSLQRLIGQRVALLPVGSE